MNCINCFICVTVTYLWKHVLVEFVEVRHIVVTRQIVSIYLIQFSI